MQPLRFALGAQEGGKSTVEITATTLQNRFLLKPDSHVNSIIAGVLARAKKRYGVEIHAHVFMSTHFHLILSIDGVKMQSRFMQYVMSNIARKVGRHIGWRGKFWQRRYRSIEINRDQASLLSRFDYVLRHGTKESLVRCPTEWPGLHCAWHYAQNQWAVTGHWDDLTKSYRLSNAGKPVRQNDYRSAESFELDPLPCWQHLDSNAIRQYVLERLEQIREAFKGNKFLGTRRILAQNIEDQAAGPKRTPAPNVHCNDPARRKEMRDAYREFVKRFLAAAARLERFLLPQEDPYYFPSGCHPPLPPAVHEFT